jgi:Kef-type K+ transport system membrane component KefB
MSFTGLVVVCAVAFVCPLLLALVPRLRLPAVVLEILVGIAIGPTGLGWVSMDEPIRVLSVLGLAFLLFLSGLEIDFTLLVGRRLQVASLGFVASIVIGYLLARGLHAAGLVESPLLVALCLSATALGIVLPVLKDAGLMRSDFGQLIMAAASIADFGTILLLSFLFSRQSHSPITQLVLLGGFAALTLLAVVALKTAGRWGALSVAMLRLQDSTSQIRIRGAFLIMVGLAALAMRQGLEVILGAFVAGALVSILDRDFRATHPKFHDKLEGIGFGVFIPVFFVASGIQFDAGALFSSTGTLLRVPMFLVALTAARGLPALLYMRMMGPRRMIVAGLLQATSLPFIVAIAAIGVELHALTRPNASALVAAGLLSVVFFPAVALALVRRDAVVKTVTTAI